MAANRLGAVEAKLQACGLELPGAYEGFQWGRNATVPVGIRHDWVVES
jgi:hypothetical protein